MSDLKDRLLKWFASGDTGVSSETIVKIAMDLGGNKDRYDIPYDGGDFGRCYRLLKACPELLDLLPKVAEVCPKWKPIVARWDELVAAYEKDVAEAPEYKDENKRSCYDLLLSMRDECYAADGREKKHAYTWEKVEVVS